MIITLQQSLNALTNFDAQKGLLQLPIKKTDAFLIELRLFILAINSELSAFFLASNQSQETLQRLKEQLHVINQRKTMDSILSLIGEQSPEKNKIKKVVSEFQTITKYLQTQSTQPTPFRFNPIPSLAISTNSKPPNARYPFNSSNGIPKDISNDDLIDTICKISSDEQLEEIAKKLDYQQVDIITAAKSCSKKIPRILTSLSKNTLFYFVIGIDNERAKSLNLLLTEAKDYDWFKEKFKLIRKEVCDVCNACANRINDLCTKVRDTNSNDYSYKILNEIEILREEIRFAKQAQRRLVILLKGITLDRATSRLFKRELPRRYRGLLNRLSDDTNAHTNVTGCPLGIIYQNAFQGIANEESSTDDDIVSESISEQPPKVLTEKEQKMELITVICSWNCPNWSDWISAGIIPKPDESTLNIWKENFNLAYEEGLTILKKEHEISSIADLKRLKIFNKAMLIDYIYRDKDIMPEKQKEKVDVQPENAIQHLAEWFLGTT